jgi:hypothetical protein
MIASEPLAEGHVAQAQAEKGDAKGKECDVEHVLPPGLQNRAGFTIAFMC